MIQHKTTIAIISKSGRFDSSDSYLLVKRANRPNRGYWAPPGGHFDAGETPLQAALRECKEEVGSVKLERRMLFSFVHDAYIGHRHRAYVFRGTPSGRIRAGSDAARAGWFTLHQMAGMNVTHYTNLVFNRLFPKLSYMFKQGKLIFLS
jgi:8-oxo-dGTP diphosphatase